MELSNMLVTNINNWTRCAMLAAFFLSTASGPVLAHSNASLQESNMPEQSANAAQAQYMLVTKQVHNIPEFTTFGGESIKDVNVGWESYGSLNADKRNVILITHFFTGTSHAAGK
jgi:hypothetical protein